MRKRRCLEAYTSGSRGGREYVSRPMCGGMCGRFTAIGSRALESRFKTWGRHRTSTDLAIYARARGLSTCSQPHACTFYHFSTACGVCLALSFGIWRVAPRAIAEPLLLQMDLVLERAVLRRQLDSKELVVALQEVEEPRVLRLERREQPLLRQVPSDVT